MAEPGGEARLRIKVCGLTRPDDARAVADAGADYVGAVLVPGSPRTISAREARAIGRAAGLPLVLVVAGEDPEETVRAARESAAAVVQLHGDEVPEVVDQVRSGGPWKVWVAARVRDLRSVESRITLLGGLADGLLLDGWDPERLGGTGNPFLWGNFTDIRSRMPHGMELIVAGGLRPENVGEAVETLSPDIVDVSSGVESIPGRKDPARVREFVRAARGPDHRRKEEGASS